MLFGLPIITIFMAFEGKYCNVFIFAFKEMYLCSLMLALMCSQRYTCTLIKLFMGIALKDCPLPVCGIR